MQQITFQSVFDTPTTPESKLNSVAQTPDGRVWEYLKATESISQYMIVSNPANLDVDTVSSSQNEKSQNVFITEASAGWTAGDFQDHWVVVDAGTGEGQLGKIKDNTADTLELYSEFAFGTALDVSDSDIVIRHYPDAEKSAINVLITPAKGVAQVAFASADYGWFLKRGVGGVLVGEAITINENITIGDDTEGSGQIGATAKGMFDENTVGRCLVANASADVACLAEVNILG